MVNREPVYMMLHTPAAVAMEVEAIAALTASIGAIEAEEWAAARVDWQATR